MNKARICATQAEYNMVTAIRPLPPFQPYFASKNNCGLGDVVLTDNQYKRLVKFSTRHPELNDVWEAWGMT